MTRDGRFARARFSNEGDHFHETVVTYPCASSQLFPIPISTPGFDNAPYFTAGNWVSKEPDTGIYNVGNYRGMVKSMLKVGCYNVLPQHLRMHREKYKEKGIPVMPAAVVIGPTPNIGLASVVKLPYDVSEYDIAGGIAGQPVELVKCQTVDLERSSVLACSRHWNRTSRILPVCRPCLPARKHNRCNQLIQGFYCVVVPPAPTFRLMVQVGRMRAIDSAEH